MGLESFHSRYEPKKQKPEHGPDEDLLQLSALIRGYSRQFANSMTFPPLDWLQMEIYVCINYEFSSPKSSVSTTDTEGTL